MRNPQGNLLCPMHGTHNIINQDGTPSGPWGVTCGYHRCYDDRCCLIDGQPEHYPIERKQVAS